MSSFRRAVDEFRGDLKACTDRTAAPRLEIILGRERPRKVSALRWAIVAILIVTLGSIPIYRDVRERARQKQERADAQLFEQVDAGLARSVPRAFDALLIPGN